MKDKDFKDYNVNEDEFMTALDELEKLDLEELEAMAAEAEGEEEEPHEFSEEFMAKQAALIREVEEREQKAARDEQAAASEKVTDDATEKIPFIYRFINTPVKKAAIVAILVGAVTLGFGGQSEAGKNPIVKFFQERYGDHIEIEPHEDLWQNEEKPQTIETVYELGWVPEGYEKVEEEISEYDTTQVYVNKLNEKVQLKQYCVYISFSIEEQKNSYKEIKKDGGKYYYLATKEEQSVVWYQYGYQFAIRGNLEMNEMLKMAQSIKIKK